VPASRDPAIGNLLHQLLDHLGDVHPHRPAPQYGKVRAVADGNDRLPFKLLAQPIVHLAAGFAGRGKGELMGEVLHIQHIHDYAVGKLRALDIAHARSELLVYGRIGLLA